eukprot:scaffold7074_cov256-Pinguiococcus_pyrenoidosus.AAC.13
MPIALVASSSFVLPWMAPVATFRYALQIEGEAWNEIHEEAHRRLGRFAAHSNLASTRASAA